MSFLLDTNVVSEIRKPRPRPGVASWFETVDGPDLFLSVLVVGEIQQGITRLRRRDRRQAATYETWLNDLQTGFADRILPVSRVVALEWGRLSAVDPPRWWMGFWRPRPGCTASPSSPGTSPTWPAPASRCSIPSTTERRSARP